MQHSGRRKFLKSAATLGAVGMIPALSGCNTEEKSKDMSGMFVHHVLFWLNEPDNEDARKAFEEAVEKLASIETVRYKHIGKPASTNREVIDTTYTYSLLVVFDDAEGHDIYQVHPIHDEFRAKSHLWNKVQIYDSI